MTNRKKRLKKSINSLEKVRKEHVNKIELEKEKNHPNDALINYWEKEIKGLILEEKKKVKLLKKVRNQL